MSTELALRPASGVLARIGTPDERQYLIQIMAEQIGIPARETSRQDVLALLASAAQRSMQYGWIPGVHMHVQKFETKDSRQQRSKDPRLKPVYSYTLVDGEKAWKDSGTRWRERGVNWRYQRKPMTLEEVREEARLMGYTQPLAMNAYGMWSRIIILGQDDDKNPDDPLWSAGIYIGKIKVGTYWNDDSLPTGVSARDVAIRRADKRAMMQSQLTLLPVDDLGQDERVARLVQHLREQAADKEAFNQLPPQRPELEVDSDGEILWVDAPNDVARKPVARSDNMEIWNAEGEVVAVVPQPGARSLDDPDNDVDWSAEGVEQDEEPDPGLWDSEDDARPEEPVARPAKSAARINDGDTPCPQCHAPAGKPHATACTATADPDARPAKSAARKQDAGARPAKQEMSKEEEFALTITAFPADRVGESTWEIVRKIREADNQSTAKMSGAYYRALIAMMQGTLRYDPETCAIVLSMLVGYTVNDSKARPGQLVHGALIKALRDEDGTLMTAMEELRQLATRYYENIVG